ncbi:MAG TPA: NAD(P)/FAD-dependent oxidoreductase [Micromonosporaceae bacterium]
MRMPRIVIVGAGFAGFHAARRLSRIARGRAEVVLVNPTDYFLYLPLLPEVATAVLDPRRITVSLPSALPRVRLILGEATRIDLDRREVMYTNPERGEGSLGYDRLVLTAGTVHKLLPIPGVAQHAHGFRNIPEALYLRDHMTRQFELADVTDDRHERDARLTFVVVGAGYTGTEVAAQSVLYTDILHRRHPRLRDHRPQWMLLDVATRILPELDERLSGAADAVLRGRGIDVRPGVTVVEADADGVRLSDGTMVPTRSLIWCVGVRPDPIVAELGLETANGRLLVDEYLAVPGRPEVYAGGDAAAVPDLTRPGQFTPMTAQHAVRQGKRIAQNIAASYGSGRPRRYRHRDLGFVVDLGGPQAAANPLGVPLAGVPAKVVTAGYHLLSLPGNRIRTAVDWALEAVLPRQTVQLGLVRSPNVPLETAAPSAPAATSVAPARTGR